MDKNSIRTSKKALLDFLEIRENFLYSDFTKKYTESLRPKKNGGYRIINPPSFKLKKVQRKILDNILYKYPQFECVYGLTKDRGVLQNAQIHQKNFNLELLTLDIENFFPSIKKKRISLIFKKIGFNKENSQILTKLCTVNNSLPQGAPTSPYLASMICKSLDKDISRFSKRRQGIYTRYFDDISISGKGVCLDKFISTIEGIVLKHGFRCKQNKRCVYKCNENKIINNILITKEALSITESYKKELINAYLNKVQNNTLGNQRIFSGKFGFFLHINKKEANQFLEKLKKQNGPTL